MLTPCCNMDHIAQVSKECLEEFMVVIPPKPPPYSKPKTVWKPLLANMMKINFDGAIFSKGCGIEVVIRNSEGLVLASLSQQLPQAYQPLEVEALAVVQALEFGAEIEVKEVVMEGDLEIIVNALKLNGSVAGPAASILQDAALFSSFVTKLLYFHVRREGNKLVLRVRLGVYKGMEWNDH